MPKPEFDPNADFEVVEQDIPSTQNIKTSDKGDDVPNGEKPDFDPTAEFEVVEQDRPEEQVIDTSYKPTGFEDPQELAYQNFMNTNPDVLNWKDKFKDKYGEYPGTENVDYDYRGAFEAGVTPRKVYGDEIPHWASFGLDGKNLKAPDHPTKWKTEYFELTGDDPDEKKVSKDSAIRAMKAEDLDVEHLITSSRLSSPEFSVPLDTLSDINPDKFNEKVDLILREENKYGDPVSLRAKKPTGTFVGDMFERLGAGGIGFVRSQFKIPKFIYDVAQIPKNEFLVWSLSSEDTTDEEKELLRKGLKTFGDFEGSGLAELADNRVTKVLEEARSKLIANSDRYDKSIEYSFKTGEYGDAIGNAVLGASESFIPSMVAGFTGGIGLANMGLVAAADKKSELDKVDNLSENVKVANSILTGASEYLTEKIGTHAIGGLIKDMFKKQGAKATQKALNNSFKSYLKTIYKKVGLYTAPVQEGATEAANQWAENWTDIMTGVDPDKDPFEGVIDAFAIGTVTGGPVTGFQISKDIKTGLRKDSKKSQQEMFDNIAESKYGQVEPKVIDVEKPPVDVEPISASFEKEVESAQSKLDEMKAAGIDVADIPFADINTRFDEFQKEAAPKEEAEGVKEVVKPEEVVEVEQEKAIDFIDSPAKFKKESGILKQDGQSLVFETDTKIYELGNIDELSGSTLSELGLSIESPVEIDTEGVINFRDKKYINPIDDKRKAVNFDSDGHVVSVSLQTLKGKKRTFRGQGAEDVAYAIYSDEYFIKPEFNTFLDEQAGEIDRQIQEVAEAEPIKDDAAVRKEARLKGKERIIEPKIKEEAKKKPSEPVKTEFQKTEDQAVDEIISESTDPDEVAATYLQELDKPANISFKEEIMRDHMGKIQRHGYERFGDPNNLQKNRQIIPNYFDKEKGLEIDDEAIKLKEASKGELTFTPDDIIDFIDKFPNGAGSTPKAGGRSDELARQFKQLTKKKLTPELAKEMTKLTSEEMAQAEGVADELFGVIKEKGLNSETLVAYKDDLIFEDYELLEDYYHARDQDKERRKIEAEARLTPSEVVEEKPIEKPKPKEKEIKSEKIKEEVAKATSTKSIESLVDDGKVTLSDKDVQSKLRVAQKNNWHENSDVDKKTLEKETTKEDAARKFKEEEEAKLQKAKTSGFNFLGIQRLINPKAKLKKLPPLSKTFSKYFGREKGLPVKAFIESTKMEGRLRARQFDIERSVKEAFKATKEAFGKKLTPENLADLQNLIENIGQTDQSLNEAIDKFGQNVPKEAIPILIEMRRNIDAHTDEIAKLNMIGVNLEEKFDKNRGYYITRTYKKHTDRNWVWDEIPAKIKTDAFDVIMDLNPELTQDEATGLLRSLLESKDIASSVVSSSNSLKDIDQKVLKKRSKFLTDNREIREFLGENRDPFYNYAVSLAKMSEIIERGKMLENFVDLGVKDGWLSKKPSDKNNLVKKIGLDTKFAGKPGTEKISDFYTTPEIDEALSRSIMGDPVTGKLMRAYMKLVTATKLAKTAGSIKGVIRNFKANPLNALGNGNWNIGQISMEIKRRVADDKTAFVREMYYRGVIGDSANQGELVRNVKDISDKLTFITSTDESVLEKSGRKVIKATLDLYGFADDVWKAYRYVSEYTRYNKAFQKTMSNEDALREAKNKAAEILHQTSTYYSQLPLAITSLRKIPIVNTFVSFPYLTLTNFIGTVSIATQELKTPNLRHIGIQRIGGITLALSGLTLYTTMLNRSEGQDEEDMEAWRRFLPDFWKNDMIAVQEVKDGKALYNNFSYLDYYGVVTTPVAILQRKFIANGKIETDDLIEVSSEFFGSFIGWDILFDKITNLKNNSERSTGFSIYNKEDTPIEQWKDISKYMFETLEPGTITDARRIYKDWRTGEDWEKKAVGVLKGSQIRTIDPVKSLDKYKLYIYKDDIDGSRKIYKDALRSYNKLKTPDEVDKKTLKEAKKRSLDAINSIINEVRSDLNALKTLGIEDATALMNRLIRDKKIDSDVRFAITRNSKIKLTDEGRIVSE